MANRIHEGDALDIAQVDTLVVAGSWLASDTITLTIASKTITITIGATVTTTAIATAIAEIWNGSTVTGDATYSALGSSVLEFSEITATVDASTVTLTGDTKGLSFTLTAAKTSTSGTLTHNANVISATGSKFWSNPGVWVGGVVPIDADDVFFQGHNREVSEGLNQSAIQPASLSFAASYTGKVGLPLYRVSGNSSYREYRNTFLQIGPVALNIGHGEGAGSSRLKIDSGIDQVLLNVYSTGRREFSDVPPFLWKGTHAANVVNIFKGDIGIAFFDTEVATIATLNIGYSTNKSSDSIVTLGMGCTLGVINKSGGILYLNSACTTLDHNGGDTFLCGDQPVTNIILDAGNIFYSCIGTITNLNIGSEGKMDFSRDQRAKTVTNCTLTRGASLLDPNATVTFTNNIILDRCSLNDVTLDLGDNRTVNIT